MTGIIPQTRSITGTRQATQKSGLIPVRYSILKTRRLLGLYARFHHQIYKLSRHYSDTLSESTKGTRKRKSHSTNISFTSHSISYISSRCRRGRDHYSRSSCPCGRRNRFRSCPIESFPQPAYTVDKAHNSVRRQCSLP